MRACACVAACAPKVRASVRTHYLTKYEREDISPVTSTPTHVQPVLLSYTSLVDVDNWDDDYGDNVGDDFIPRMNLRRARLSIQNDQRDSHHPLSFLTKFVRGLV